MLKNTFQLIGQAPGNSLADFPLSPAFISHCDCRLNMFWALQGRGKLVCIAQITVTGERQVGFSPLNRTFETPSFLDIDRLEP